MRLGLWSASALILVGLTIWSAPAQTGKKKHPRYHLHHALWELRDARNELVQSTKKFEGRQRTIAAVDTSIKYLEIILQYKGDGTAGVPDRKDGALAFKKFKNHPHLRHALIQLRDANKELKAAPHNFNGNRKAAIVANNAAISEIEAFLTPKKKKKNKK